MRRTSSARVAAIVAVAGLVSGWAGDARAQLKGHYIPGFTGLQNGSQAPPGINVILPVYWYNTDDIKNDDGQSLGAHPASTWRSWGPAPPG